MRQVSQGAKQSPRHFNPKRLDCFIYKASLGSGPRGASGAKVHQASSIGRSRTDLRRHTDSIVTPATAEGALANGGLLNVVLFSVKSHNLFPQALVFIPTLNGVTSSN